MASSEGMRTCSSISTTIAAAELVCRRAVRPRPSASWRLVRTGRRGRSGGQLRAEGPGPRVLQRIGLPTGRIEEGARDDRRN